MRFMFLTLTVALCVGACSGESDMNKIVRHYKAQGVLSNESRYHPTRDKVVAALIAHDEEGLLELTSPGFREKAGDEVIRNHYRKNVLPFFSEDVAITNLKGSTLVNDGEDMGLVFFYELKGKDGKTHNCRFSIFSYSLTNSGQDYFYVRTIEAK